MPQASLIYTNKKGKLRTKITSIDKENLGLGPPLQSTLNLDQITRAQKIMLDMDFEINHPTMTKENWLLGFTRDAHPEREIRIWERCAKVYSEMKLQTPHQKKRIYRLAVSIMNGASETEFFKQAKTLQLKNAPKMFQLAKDLRTPTMYRKISDLEKEWCLGHPWRMEAHLVHRRILAKLWHEKFTLAQKKEVLSLSAEEINRFLANSHALCFFSRGELLAVVSGTINQPWTTEKQTENKGWEQIVDVECGLPHPVDDNMLFSRIYDLFFYAIFCEKDCQIYYSEITRFPEVRHFDMETEQYDKEIECKPQELYQGMMEHGDKLVTFASLCIMEKKLMNLSKRICAQCDVISETAYKSCAKCKFTYYCSVECQKKDWKEHKMICKDAAIFGILDKAQRLGELPVWHQNLLEKSKPQ